MSCECGEQVKVYEVEIPFGPSEGKKIETKMGCKCEDLKLAKQALDERHQKKVEKMISYFESHSLINKELQQATIDSYQPSDETQVKAKKIAQRYIDVFDKKEPRNLLFCGSYGIGKSHLAKSITDGVIEKGYSAIFISVPKLLSKFRSSYNKESEISEGQMIEALNHTDVLVLDDLGAEKSSEWAIEKLFEVIDSRQGMHTIYTSNYCPKDLIQRLGERNFSRVVNRDTTIVEIEGDNYRLGKFA